MPENMNIAVLGPVPRDNITTYQGEKLEKFGCAVYTAVCISALAGAGFAGRLLPPLGDHASVPKLIAAALAAG